MPIQVQSWVLYLQIADFPQPAPHIIPGSEGHTSPLGYSVCFPAWMMMMAMSRGLSARSAPPHSHQFSELPPPLFPPELHHYFLFTAGQGESLAPPFPSQVHQHTCLGLTNDTKRDISKIAVFIALRSLDFYSHDLQVRKIKKILNSRWWKMQILATTNGVNCKIENLVISWNLMQKFQICPSVGAFSPNGIGQMHTYLPEPYHSNRLII